MSRQPRADQARAHASVLLEGAVDALIHDPRGAYLDGTFGRGGHSRAILSRLAPEGRLLALDRDPEACAAAAAIDDSRFAIERTAFDRLTDAADRHELHGALSGILLDIGVSSPQLDDGERGFSFMRDGPLDMRMDPDSGESAARWLSRAGEREIADVFKRLGEERFARRLARAVVERRQQAPITRTVELAELLKAAHPAWEKGRHPATRAFQAIRIHINDELGQLERALTAALEALAPGGHLVVISFHSLEDRLVKRFIRDQSRGDAHLPRGLPLREDQLNRRLEPLGRARYPNEAEVADNPRARSAVLRAARKLDRESS
ncbi:16S rRNA (cytosine1402-N4)-methyltransferase [Kushneria sinocarnis]|uniref:Ribosomal RNA small subunit methyltransferase H n=1 Tax=Kushneria sinocarnis TaxID=595502 RepID=A0A420WVC6_9GAMM|nr:16S rRNA (cytosine(1402)-N(4))-methyltransferase RsmH [Kushneria sinocarnis]RKR02503.1 16S rRNA (cytosine1402-N4)-methyltransferase [Kushneria sinocarnis]